MLVRNFLAILTIGLCLWPSQPDAQMLDEAELATYVEPPFELGERIDGTAVYSIRDRSGLDAGWIFETEPIAPLPGFSGAPINILVTIDREGRFYNAELLQQNEPVFVSGLGEAPFHAFMRQYRGLSIFDTITVGVPYGAGDRESSALHYLDGVTKATASVRIAHESILAAALQVAREKLTGAGGGSPVFPKHEYQENLDWQQLIEEGIATRRILTNREVEEAFSASLWEDDDPAAKEQLTRRFWIL